MTPVSLGFLRLVTRSAKMIYDFQDCFGEYVASVIELKWEQDLESPLFAAHKWFCLLRRMECPDQQVLQERLRERCVHLIAKHGQRSDPAKRPARAFQSHDQGM